MDIYRLLAREYILEIPNDKNHLYAKNAISTVSMGLDFFRRGVQVADLNHWYGVDGWKLLTPEPGCASMSLKEIAYALADLEIEGLEYGKL